MRTSVYQRALGPRFEDLDPRLRAYFGPLPVGCVGVGVGTYDVAGSRMRALSPILALCAWRRILFPEFGRDVPFQVRNEPRPDGTLAARRDFSFPARTRTMQDVLSATGPLLVDRLGRRGGLEVTFDVTVVDAGVRLRSHRLGWRIGRVRIALPRLARVTVDERIVAGRQRVDARVRVPVFGEVFRYTGSFTYEVVVASGAPPEPGAPA